MRVIIFVLILFSFIHANYLYDINIGVVYYKQKKYEKALEIFDRVLINHPNSKRARLEYARVLYAMGRYKESKKEFLYVLNQNPPPLVKKNIKWFIKKIEKKQKKNFCHGFVSIGVSSDDNIENKSDNPIYAGFIDKNTKKREDRYTTVELFLQHSKKFEKSFWQNSLYLYDESAHDQKQDKISYINLSTAYIFFMSGIRISLPLSASITNVENKRYLNTINIHPSTYKKIDRKNAIYADMLLEYNKNFEDSDKNTKVYGIGARWINRLYKFTNKIGVTYKTYKKTQGKRIDISKDRVSFDIGTSYNIFPTNLLSLFYRKSQDKYKEKDPSINDERIDKLDKFNLDFKQSISKNQFFELGFTKITNKSNLDIFSYDKNIISMKVKQTF